MSPRANACMTASFSSEGILPCSDLDPDVGERADAARAGRRPARRPSACAAPRPRRLDRLVGGVVLAPRPRRRSRRTRRTPGAPGRPPRRCAPRPARTTPASRRAARRRSGCRRGPRASCGSSRRRGRRTPSSRPCAGSASPSARARAATSPSRAATRAARRRTGAARRRRRVRGRRTWCVSLSRACVPTTMRACPDAVRSAALRRSAAGSWPVSSVGMSSGASCGPSIRAIERRCCPASTSVGAMSADWPPLSATWSIARSATSVLPEPTSPCTSRFIGQSPSRSRGDLVAHGRPGRACAAKGSDASKPLEERTRRRAASPTARGRTARCCSSATCSTNASCMRSVLRACSIWSSKSGRWMRSIAVRASSSPSRRRRLVGQRVGDRAEPVEHELDDLRELPARDRAGRGVDRDRQVRVRLGASAARSPRRRTARSRDARAASRRGTPPPCRRRCRGARDADPSRATPG